jgi:enamine deaminase RidA (YjgF/YER057c/UK114 family)
LDVSQPGQSTHSAALSDPRPPQRDTLKYKFTAMGRLLLRTAASLALLSLIAVTAFGGRKKKEEEPKPQVLPLPKELPRVLSVDTRNVSFRTTPLLKYGRLSAQVRETLADLIKDRRGETVIKLRAFVAGPGDTRRVQEMVSEMFTEKKLPLPVLTILQVGALGEESGVVMEGVFDAHKPMNPNGLAFIGGQTGTTFESAVSVINSKLQVAGLAASDVVRATCFTGQLTDYAGLNRTLASAFPQAALNIVQPLRDPVDSRTTCEAIARIPAGAKPAALPSDSRICFVNSPQLVFTGLQLSFGTYLADADSALSHLSRDVQSLHAEMRNAVSVNAFSLHPAAASALEKTISKFNLSPQTITIQPVEGLPSLDAALGMEAVLEPSSAATQTTGALVMTAKTRL